MDTLWKSTSCCPLRVAHFVRPLCGGDTSWWTSIYNNKVLFPFLKNLIFIQVTSLIFNCFVLQNIYVKYSIPNSRLSECCRVYDKIFVDTKITFLALLAAAWCRETWCRVGPNPLYGEQIKHQFLPKSVSSK